MNKISFQGIKISSTSIKGQELNLYKLNQNDTRYIKKLKNTINYNTLNPNESKTNNAVFNAILYEGFTRALQNKQKSMLLTCNNIPCGLMVTTPDKYSSHIDYVCTWPMEPNKKAHFGGKTLFLQLFKDTIENSKNFIQLNATKYGNAISKYLRLGFKPIGGNNQTETMKIDKNKILETIIILEKDINLTPSKTHEDVDLFKETNIIL